MKVLVLNCGSSSLKFLLIDTAEPAQGRLASGQVERIGGQGLLSWRDAAGKRERAVEAVHDHRVAIDLVLRRPGPHAAGAASCTTRCTNASLSITVGLGANG